MLTQYRIKKGYGFDLTGWYIFKVTSKGCKPIGLTYRDYTFPERFISKKHAKKMVKKLESCMSA